MQQRLFLIRGFVAVVWAVAFATASSSLTTGAKVLLVLYALIDAVASVIDARGQQGSARQLLELNAVVSVAVAVALGIAATGDTSDVRHASSSEKSPPGPAAIQPTTQLPEAS